MLYVTYTSIKLILVPLRQILERNGNDQGRPVGTVAKLEHQPSEGISLSPARPWLAPAKLPRFSREAGNLDFHMRLDFFFFNISNKFKLYKALCGPNKTCLLAMFDLQGSSMATASLRYQPAGRAD